MLETVRPELEEVRFDVEEGRRAEERIHRPVLFGEDGEPELQYEVDGYHPEWRCGSEVEAGRALQGNAIYRDLIQAAVMVRTDTLALAVPNAYRCSSGTNRAFEETRSVVETLYRTKRFDLPYDLLPVGH